MKKSEEPIIIEQSFDCAVSTLWEALTEPERMRRWYFDNIPDFRPKPGFYTEFMVDAGERQFLHQWTVAEAIPGNKLVYRWTYAGYDGSALSIFLLGGDERRSHLRLSFDVEEDFSDDVPEFRRESCAGGWEYFINQRLKNYLAAG